MNPNRPSDRRRRRATLQPEMLESRKLLTGGTGNTFAIMTADLTTATPKAIVPFTYQPSLITLNAKHSMTLGIDVAAQSGSTAVGKIVAVEDLQTHHNIPFSRSTYSKAVQLADPSDGNQTSAVLVNLHLTAAQAAQPHQYAVVVQAKGGTTGEVLVGFYLPGDANGTGTVDNSSIEAIKQDMNVSASSQNYNFAADANRDGIINNQDVRIAKQNMGVSTVITPVVSANLSPVSDSGIQDRITDIQDVNFLGTATPGATVTFVDTDNTSPTTSTTVGSNGNYSLNIPLGPGANTYQVTVTDGFGQTITGEIAPVTYSLTAPTATTTLPTIQVPTATQSTSSSSTTQTD